MGPAALKKGSAYVFSITVTNGRTPQPPPPVFVSVISPTQGVGAALVPGISSAAQRMGAAASYSDTRALFILTPVDLAAHVGCRVELRFRVREGRSLYTTTITTVNPAEEAIEAAAAAAASAALASSKAVASKAAAAVAALEEETAIAVAAAAATARQQADAVGTSFPLPPGAVLGEAICRHYPDPSTVVKGPGIGGCTEEDRTLVWTPGRELWGLNSIACFRGGLSESLLVSLPTHLPLLYSSTPPLLLDSSTPLLLGVEEE